jgi:hypothetical protein
MDRMKKVLNSNAIKVIAIIAMTIDHIAWFLFPGYSREVVPILMHMIGRITCPIMCYCVAEGYHYTKDVNKYTARLFLFAAISHFAYVFALTDFVDWRSFIPFYYGGVLNQTSVMWSLAWGLVMLRIVHSKKIKESLQPFLIMLICLIGFIGDWSCIASLCILAIGTNRGDFNKQMLWMILYMAMYAAVYFYILDPVYGLLQMAVILSIPIIKLYNGQRGQNSKINTILKYGFYLYYPLHLFVLGWIQAVR